MSLWSQPPRKQLWASPMEADENVWSQQPLSTAGAVPSPAPYDAIQPLPLQFNPLRRAHVRQVEEAEAQERIRRRAKAEAAEAAAASRAHAAAGQSHAAAPAFSGAHTTALFRLPGSSAAGAIVSPYWGRDATAPPAPVSVFADMLAAADAEAAAHEQQQHSSISSPLSRSSATPSPRSRVRSPPSPGAHAPSSSSTSTPAAVATPAPRSAPLQPVISVSFRGDYESPAANNSSASANSSVGSTVLHAAGAGKAPPPTQEQLDELTAQIEFIDRQLRGEAPLTESPPRANRSIASPEQWQTEQGHQSDEVPRMMMPTGTVAAASTSTPTSPMAAQQSRASQRLPYDYLSAQERRVLEQYKREQAWLEHRAEAAPPSDPFSVLDACAASSSAAAGSSSSSTPYKLDATKLDESVPSTITEETSLRDDSRHTDVDAHGSLNTSRADDDRDAAGRSFERKQDGPVALYSPSKPTQREHVTAFEPTRANQIAAGAPLQVDMALAQLPSLPAADDTAAATASASLSSLMRVSDLAYPDLLLQGYNNSSSAARSLQPWRTPQHIPNPLAPPQPAAMPTAAEWMEQRQRERQDEREQRELDTRDDALHASMRQRLHDGFARILDPAASIGAVEGSFFASSGRGPKKDSNGSLLESLWAAEADFERMLAEELPEVRLPQHRNSRQQPQRAAPSPAPAPTSAVAAVRPHSSPAQSPKSARALSQTVTAVGSPRQHDQAATSVAAAAPPRSPLTRSQRVGFAAGNLAASPRRSPQRQQQQEEQVAYRPGALLQPRDEVKVAFLDVPLPQANNARRPDIGGRQLQRALEEAQSSSAAANQFLQVASWDANHLADEDGAAVDAEELKFYAGSGGGGGGDVLLAVEDFVMPAALAELLDVDVDPVSGRLARFQPQQHQSQAPDCFGRLVPMRITQILNQVEREGRAAGLVQQQSQSQSPSSSPRLAHSHLHAGPDPATLQRHIAMRRAKESMREMDEELEQLTQRAAALSAEYQSDSRAITAYEQRMAKRKEDLLSIKLSHAQQLQLQQRANADRARSTLQEIDDIMAERQPSLARVAPSAVDAQARSPPMSPRRRPPVMHSPRGLTRPEQLAALGGAGPRPLSASPVRATTTAAAAASTARPSRIPVAANGSVRPAGVKPKPRPPPVRKQRMAKLESELDSALSQAQKLMDNFMHQLA